MTPLWILTALASSFALAAAPPSVVTGRVLAPDGGLVIDAGVTYTIEFEGRGSIYTGTRTGLDGGFAIPWPSLTETPEEGDPFSRPAKPEEISDVRMYASVGPQFSPEACVDGGVVTLRLREPATLTVRAKGASDKKPVTLESSVLWPPPSENGVNAAFFDKREVTSTATFPVVPAGLARVHASRGNLVGFAETELAPGGAGTIDVSLAEGAELSLSILDPLTEKPADFDVEVTISPGTGTATEAVTEGRIQAGDELELQAVIPTEQTIKMSYAGLFESVHRVRIRPGEKRKLSLPFVSKFEPGSTGMVALDYEGALMAIVAPGSPAARAGVRTGDTVVEVDEVKVTSEEQAAKLLKGKPGSKVAVRLGDSSLTGPSDRTIVVQRAK